MPDTTKWTRFSDMHSGGGTKIPPYEYIFIEAPEEEARKIFRQRFGRDPDHVTCDCCGRDYDCTEWDDLEQATGYQRGCDYVYPDESAREGRYVERPKHSGRAVVPLAEYLTRGDVLVIRKEDHA